MEILSKANAVKEKVHHLDQLEFLPIFPYSDRESIFARSFMS